MSTKKAHWWIKETAEHLPDIAYRHPKDFDGPLDELTYVQPVAFAETIEATSTSPDNELEVLTLPEVAKWLRISERTVATFLSDYPHFRAGKQIRFLKSELLRKAKQESNGKEKQEKP